MLSVYKNYYTLTFYTHIKIENIFLLSCYVKNCSLTTESWSVSKKVSSSGHMN